MSFARYYRRNDDGALMFREAWHDADTGQFVLNHGEVGHQSATAENCGVDQATGERMLVAFTDQCGQDGYIVIEPKDQFHTVAQFALKTTEGTERDKYLENKAVATITSHFAWRGIGTVERSEFAPSRLNIYCLAPDPAKAVAALKVCLREARLDFTKLRIGVAPYDDIDAIRQRYPMPAKSRFVL